MSRINKYRAWDEKRQVYYYNVAVLPGGITGLRRSWIHLGTEEEDEWLPRLELVLEQYTGFTDKNGVEIYEGDIVKVVTPANLAVIIWADDMGSFAHEWLADNTETPIVGVSPECMEVIGNIHENPELLNSRSQEVKTCNSTELNERRKNETTR